MSVFAAIGGAGIACNQTEHASVAVSRNDCATCHMPEYKSAQQPLHIGNFPTACNSCHSELMWSPAQGFDHEHFFGLQGAHKLVTCGQCHTRGYNRGDTPTDCVGCHRKDYDTSPFPGHQSFSTQCTDCHNTVAWKPAVLSDHDQFFPLEGKHRDVTCASCHTVGYKAGDTPKDCVGCHRKDYDTSPFPNHNTFPTTCADCHKTSGWEPATIPDHDKFFPLDGKHAAVSCASCHTQGYASGATPKDCVGCHKQDYDKSPYPGHASFPTTCRDCHMTSGWTPASGGHPESKFPITSGAHRGITCANCHNSSLGANGKGNADCVGCHTGEHTRARMDAKHTEVRNYPTGAAAPNFCLSCHPTGRGG